MNNNNTRHTLMAWAIVFCTALFVYGMMKWVDSISPNTTPAVSSVPTQPETDPSTASSTPASNQDPSSESPGVDTQTAAYKLAAADSGSSSPDVTTVGEYQDKITSLHRIQDGVTDEQIANVAQKTHEILANKGIDESALSLMEAIDQAVPAGLEPHVPDAFAAYATLREKGMSRDDAINQLNGLIYDIAHPQ